MDWSQVLGYASKAADIFKKAIDTLAVERDIVIPESVLNTALATIASRSTSLHALSFELHDNWFDVDLVYVYQGIEFSLRASFDVENITFDHHKQTLILRERRPIELSTKRFKSTWQQWGFNLWAWWLRQFKKTTPLIDTLEKIEGMSVKDGIYRMDFSFYIRRKPAFIATLYALEIKSIKILDKEIYIRGSADLKSLNLLNELYKLLPNPPESSSPTTPAVKQEAPMSEAEADVVIDKILANKFKDEG